MKNLFKTKKKPNKNFGYYIDELIFTFIFRDILYVILPLIVILFTYYVFGSLDMVDFLSSSDLAFAVTVLNAMALSSFIEVKVKHQNPNSWRLFEGSKLYILLIVVSTLLLSFIILNEISVLGKALEKKNICQYNVGLFFLSCVALFLKSSVLLKQKYGIGEKIDASRLFRKVKNTLNSADFNLENLLYLIEKTDIKDLQTFPEDERQIEIAKKHELEDIILYLKQNKEKLELLENQMIKLYK